MGRKDAAPDEFAWSEFSRTQYARRVWATDGPQQPTWMYSRRVLEDNYPYSTHIDYFQPSIACCALALMARTTRPLLATVTLKRA